LVDETIKATNGEKARAQEKVEHSIGAVKRVFGFQKVCYRGLAKNLHRREVAAVFAKLCVVRRQLLRLQG
jgi:IS5 family transposase